ncbi:MAG: hypothetical protein ABIC18_03710 [Candidatus Omnitrophota bacterium]
MPYDPNLDECLFQEPYETEASRLTVSVYSYNKGPKKLQIARENKGAQDEFRFAKLGRLSKEEASRVLPLIQKALDYMD